jgi:hypothetical protein
MKAYKLFRVRKNGTIGSLFINKKMVIQPGCWLPAQSFPTKGYKFRPVWHCTSQPEAPHLSEKNRQWFQVEIRNWKKFKRPSVQGGVWYLAGEIKVLKPV